MGNREAVTREKGDEAALAGGGAAAGEGGGAEDGSERAPEADIEAERATAERPEGVSVTRAGAGRGEGEGGMYSFATTEAIICSEIDGEPVVAEPVSLRAVRATLAADVLCAWAARVSLRRRSSGDESASVGAADDEEARPVIA